MFVTMKQRGNGNLVILQVAYNLKMNYFIEKMANYPVLKSYTRENLFYMKVFTKLWF